MTPGTQYFLSFRDHKFMISMKNVQFLHTPPSPLFLFVRMDPNWERPPPTRLWARPPPLPPAPGWNLGYQRPPPPPQPPSPHSFWYSCSISIIFSRRFHQIPCPCYSKLFTTKNQYKVNSIFWSNTQAKMSHLEC